MSKHQKALERLRARPVASDIKWSELKAVLEHLGYEMLANSGSRRKFVHMQTKALIICHEPHPSPSVEKGCIAAVVSHLEAQGFI